jgi:hypothetical protein
MELEIQKDIASEARKSFYSLRALCGKELVPDLEQPSYAAKLPR